MYVKRLEELRKTGDVMVMREAEWTERPKAFDELAATIIHYEKILTQYRDEVRSHSHSLVPVVRLSLLSKTNDTYRHIEEGEMKKVEEAVNAKRAWMNTKQHACSQAAKHSNPSVKSSEIRAEKSVRHCNCCVIRGAYPCH